MPPAKFIIHTDGRGIVSCFSAGDLKINIELAILDRIKILSVERCA